MNVTDANFVVGALNRIAELVTALAADVEQQAWDSFEDHAGMSGARPMAAHSLADPSATPTVSKQPELPPSEPEAVSAVALEEVRGVLAGLSSQGHTAQVRELILEAGADRLSSVDPARYGWLLARAKELADGSN